MNRARDRILRSKRFLIHYRNVPVFVTKLTETERKQMVSALKYKQEKFRLLTEFTSDVIWVLNLKNIKTYLSPCIYYLSGQTAEEH